MRQRRKQSCSWICILFWVFHSAAGHPQYFPHSDYVAVIKHIDIEKLCLELRPRLSPCTRFKFRIHAEVGIWIRIGIWKEGKPRATSNDSMKQLPGNKQKEGIRNGIKNIEMEVLLKSL